MIHKQSEWVENLYEPLAEDDEGRVFALVSIPITLIILGMSGLFGALLSLR